jgi:hypothetical protein
LSPFISPPPLFLLFFFPFLSRHELQQRQHHNCGKLTALLRWVTRRYAILPPTHSPFFLSLHYIHCSENITLFQGLSEFLRRRLCGNSISVNAHMNGLF